MIKSKNRDFPLNSKNMESRLGFLIPKARLVFIKLWQRFVKVPILHHFYSKCHIRIETNASRYAIGGTLSQLTLDDLGEWHLIAFFSQKIISIKTRYKTYNVTILAIVKVFKTWQHYLKSCKHKVFIFTDYNNICRFMDIKSLSSKQAYLALQLFSYHF